MKRGQAPPPCGGSCLDAGRTRHCCLRKSGVLVCLGPFICIERDPKESVHTEHLRETLESFAATFSLSDTFSQRMNRKAWAHHSAVLQAVGNRFGHAVDANGHAINSRVDHVLGQGIARKPDEAQSQTVDEGAFSLCRRWPSNSGQSLSEEWRHLGSLAALSAAVLAGQQG
jgi:hypothetical protein